MKLYLSLIKLKNLRSENGFSQETLAKASGLSVRTIQRIESNGKASAESLISIASVLNVSPVSLKAENSEIEVSWTKKNILV